MLNGDADAFEPLVTAYQSRIYQLALKMTGNEEDAFDLSQETFLKAYRTLSGYRGEAGFGSWLYRIAANLCIDHLRKRKRRGMEKLVYLDERDEDGRSLELPDLRFEPQQALERQELRRAVQAGLRRLPPEQRLILTLRDVQDLSYQEIGEALALEPGTVRSRIHRARARLARILSSDGNFPAKAASKEAERR